MAKGNATNVVFVQRQYAKQAKDLLELKNVLDKRFRMTPSVVDEYKEAIAIPVNAGEESMTSLAKLSSSCEGILAQGQQFCPYSTFILGNVHHHVPGIVEDGLLGNKTSTLIDTTSPVEQALVAAIRLLDMADWKDECILEKIKMLPQRNCPKRLELHGDDRTLVIPSRALSLDEATFSEWLNNEFDVPSNAQMLERTWEQLALLYNSPRVVRRAEVKPESRIRESNYEILWPLASVDRTDETGVPIILFVFTFLEITHFPNKITCFLETGPGSSGWITVTEQGIRQSFDLTRVMFSRGNISEKVRFGKLVQPDEVVLDMYGGIGYFTLPALVHGKAKHVYACEWNTHAVQALRFNLEDNRVADRASVLQGDCRKLVMEHNLVRRMDRVILGLLPSSEGGWETAMLSLKPTGGWLHIHGNVPIEEVNNWALWICSRLASMTLATKSKQHPDDGLISMVAAKASGVALVVLCTFLEKVKSFAPTINHYVADVYFGPPRTMIAEEYTDCVAGIILQNGDIAGTIPKGSTVTRPSCALASHGALHQDWMFPPSGE